MTQKPPTARVLQAAADLLPHLLAAAERGPKGLASGGRMWYAVANSWRKTTGAFRVLHQVVTPRPQRSVRPASARS